ncbi:MAG: hypothetical protein ACLP0L_14425 [Solirubrobacteraceae bacterium]
MLGPEHGGGHGDPLVGRRRYLGEASGDGAGPSPVPHDRGGERSGLAVQIREAIEISVARDERRP